MNLPDNAQKAMDKVIAKFQSGDISPMTDLARTKISKDAPAHGWSWNNQVLALAQTGCLDCRTYRAWQLAGRQVRKGEKCCYILRPVKFPKTNEDGEQYWVLVGFKPQSEFAYHQTDPIPGMEQEAFTYEPKDPPPLMELAEKFGLKLTYGAEGGHTYGSYNQKAESITLDSTDPEIWFHELAHAAHKQVVGELKGGQDPHQETTAQLAACILMDLYDEDRTGNTWDYIRSYNRDDPLRAIMEASNEVGKVLEVILQ